MATSGYCQVMEPDRISHTWTCRDFKVFDKALSHDEAVEEFNRAMRHDDNCGWDEEEDEEEFNRVFSDGTSKVLVIWDLHEPYCLKGYLEFCKEQYEFYECDTVVFIGDIADFCSLSYHERATSTANPEREYAQTITALQKWYKAFPEAIVLLGNHDKLPTRKLQTIWLPRQMMKSWNDIFKAPEGWRFEEEWIIDDVLYRHGDSGDAYGRCVKEWMSLVQGHLHQTAWVQFYKNRVGWIFWMQAGTWIDREKKAFDYARNLPKLQFISCWVVLDWVQPIVIPYVE